MNFLPGDMTRPSGHEKTAILLGIWGKLAWVQVHYEYDPDRPAKV
jgi:hypothetical protein